MKTYRVVFEVTVTDEELLLEYANERLEACWRSSLQEMTMDDEEPVERALLETILFSNENPSPDAYGIEFGGVAEIHKVGGEPAPDEFRIGAPASKTRYPLIDDPVHTSEGIMPRVHAAMRLYWQALERRGKGVGR